MLWRERTGRTSVQVLGECYVTVTRKLKPGVKADDAWDDVQALMSWEPQPIDVEVLERAQYRVPTMPRPRHRARGRPAGAA